MSQNFKPVKFFSFSFRKQKILHAYSNCAVQRQSARVLGPSVVTVTKCPRVPGPVLSRWRSVPVSLDPVLSRWRSVPVSLDPVLSRWRSVPVSLDPVLSRWRRVPVPLVPELSRPEMMGRKDWLCYRLLCLMAVTAPAGLSASNVTRYSVGAVTKRWILQRLHHRTEFA
jgi:hypothetical protein